MALEKVCKIHRKLPAGGILVFLTGKQEIVRMVNRLRQRLKPRSGKKSGNPEKNQTLFTEGNDVNETLTSESLEGLREMDDEEADGDLFQKDDVGEEKDDFNSIENEDMNIEPGTVDDDDKRPKKVRILPLYSMLSADEQAKVFAPVPDDHRLIVIATNIAEVRELLS